MAPVSEQVPTGAGAQAVGPAGMPRGARDNGVHESLCFDVYRGRLRVGPCNALAADGDAVMRLMRARSIAASAALTRIAAPPPRPVTVGR